MENKPDSGKFIINYDPANPRPHLEEFGLSDIDIEPEAALPHAIPWPEGSTPTPVTLPKAPDPSEDLSKFSGYDAVVVTWTAAEAEATANIFTPGVPLTSWYEYKHDLATYEKLVTGGDAPFNDLKYPRYYHSMGLYYPIRIGNAKVLLFKSGLHFAYDGPSIPLKKLVKEIFDAVKPKIFITTGTGGAIGTEVLLGDVVLGAATKFDCKHKFQGEPFATQSIDTSVLPAKALTLITQNLLTVNASRVQRGNPQPKMWHDASSIIVTTDKFEFDDSTNDNQLQGLGKMCDMGDSMVNLALQPISGFQFFAIRNASDPQIPNPTNDYKAADKESTAIYAKYGALTSAASLIATWAVIHSIINKP